MNNEPHIKKLRTVIANQETIIANALTTKHSAEEIIKELQGGIGRKERRVNGLTDADRARIAAHRMKSMIRK